MGDLQTFLDLLKEGPYLLICGGLLWFIRGKASVWDKHVKDCGEIPKKVIIEKLDGIKTCVDANDKKLDDLSTTVSEMVGREKERDRQARHV